MLTRFEVENYKNFKNKIVFALNQSGGYKYNQKCLNEGIISKALIYGRNASGKTNLGNALMDITDYKPYRRMEQIFTNADSPDDIARFKYCFLFYDIEVEYYYEKKDEQVFAFESLSIGKNKVFTIDYRNKQIYDLDLSLVSAETLIVDRFFDSLNDMIDDNNSTIRNVSFLRWIVANSALKKDSIIVALVEYINRMRFVSVGSSIEPMHPIFRGRMLRKIDSLYLRELEEFFGNMGIDCKLVLRRLPEGDKKLYFDHRIPVPFFETASSGTLALFNLFWNIVHPSKGTSFLFLDEFDAFYHYEMAENLFCFFKEHYPTTQIAFTTHNTNLMTNRLLRPDCLFIISQDGRLTSLNNATERELREGHNLEKLYISGEFEDYE